MKPEISPKTPFPPQTSLTETALLLFPPPFNTWEKRFLGELMISYLFQLPCSLILNNLPFLSLKYPLRDNLPLSDLTLRSQLPFHLLLRKSTWASISTNHPAPRFCRNPVSQSCSSSLSKHSPSRLTSDWASERSLADGYHSPSAVHSWLNF